MRNWAASNERSKNTFFGRDLRVCTCFFHVSDVFRISNASQWVLHLGEGHFAPIPPQTPA